MKKNVMRWKIGDTEECERGEVQDYCIVKFTINSKCEKKDLIWESNDEVMTLINYYLIN